MIDKEKQYETRDGREVRIYATDHAGDFPVIGAIKTRLEGWRHSTWLRDGAAYYGQEEHPTDLIEIRPRIKREYWVNVMDNGAIVSFHDNKEDAIEWRGSETEACVKVVIDCEKGEGL